MHISRAVFFLPFYHFDFCTKHTYLLWCMFLVAIMTNKEVHACVYQTLEIKR